MSQDIPVIFSWAILLIGVLIQLIFARSLTNRLKGWLAFLTSIAALFFLLNLWPAVLAHQALDIRWLIWDSPASFAYHVDGLGFFFAFIAIAIGSVILFYSIEYTEDEPGCTRFYALMLTFIAGLVHLVFTADLLLVYLSWEVIGLCSFLLVGFWFTQPEAAKGARKVFVMTHIAGYGLLAAVLTVFHQSGSTLWTDSRVAAAFNLSLLILVFIAAMAKSVQFPLHTWIPDAMAAPTPVSALLHAACYVTAGVYLMARMRSIVLWPPAFEALVISIASLTMLIGALFAMVQTDLKRLLAFSTVSQVGYMMLGIGIGTSLGIAAGLLLCLNHALFKGGLFLCAGKIQHETGSRDLDRLGGLSRWMPRTTAFWLILAGSISGLPLLSGFVSKWLLYHAALEAHQSIAVLISWLVSVITVFYFLKASNSAFFGEEGSQPKPKHEHGNLMEIGIGTLAAGSLALGVAPQLAMTSLINPLLVSMGQAPLGGVSWMGITLDGGNWFTSLGLGLAVLAVLLGGLLYLIMAPARKLITAGAVLGEDGGGAFSGGEPLLAGNRFSAGDFASFFSHQLKGFYTTGDADRYYLQVWRGLNWVGEKLSALSGYLEKNAILWLTLFVICAGLGVAAFDGGSSPKPSLVQMRWLLPFAVGISLMGFLALALTLRMPNQSRWLMLLSGAAILIGMLSQSELWMAAFLEAGALLAVALIWKHCPQNKIRLLYLFVFLLSAVCSLIVALAGEQLPPSLARALWISGIGIKLAVFPLYLWLPMVAEALPAVVVGFLISVVDIAALGEMILLRQTADWLFSPPGIWLGLACASGLFGAWLMLGQRDIKRLLAFSTIEDLGYLIFAAIMGGELGIQAAVIGAAVHALAKTLLFASLAGMEADGMLTANGRGMAQKYPLSNAAFLVGLIAILGVPPTLGYASRWRIYEVAVSLNPWILGILLISSSLALLAYGRTLAVFWWGAPNDAKPSLERPPKISTEPLTLRWMVWLIGILLVAGGLVPFLVN